MEKIGKRFCYLFAIFSRPHYGLMGIGGGDLKIIMLILSVFFMTSCATVPSDVPMESNQRGTIMIEEGNIQSAMESYGIKVNRVMNFRTSDGLELVNENRILRNYEEFEQYNLDYQITENPFFIDEQSLSDLEKVDRTFFEKKGFIAVVLVESSGSNSVTGEGIVMKDKVAEALVNRSEAGMGTADMATRHVLYELSQEDLQMIQEVRVIFNIAP